MEVTVQINLGSRAQEVLYRTDPDETVQKFINDFCQQHGITDTKGVILSNEEGVVFKKSSKLSHYNIEPSQQLILTTWTGGGRECSCSQWWLLALVALFIGAAGVAAVSVIKINEGSIPDAYGIVFDAGSSHTQMYIYKWEGDKENGTAIATQVYTMRAEGGGISEYEDVKDAGASLQKPLEEAKKQIPHSQYSKTSVYLGATAGMRLLNEKNKTQSDAIMQSVRDTLSKSTFLFSDSQARILDGKEEGSFAWITVNYLDGKFDTYPRRSTSGSLDLGGASTQITFVPDSGEQLDAKYEETLLLYGYNYSVYTHSYLCYGSNEAHRKYLASLVLNAGGVSNITDPCLPSGNTTVVSFDDVFEAPCTSAQKPSERMMYTFQGSSNSALCHNLTKNIFNFTAPCGHPQEQCTFNGVYQPPVYGSFKAFSQFYFTMYFLNVTEGTLQDFRKATEQFCSQSWDEIKDLVLPPSVLQYITHYCFNAHYIDILLTDGYKFTDSNWNTIVFTNQIDNTDLGWSLGFMLNASNAIPEQQPLVPLSLPLFITLVVLFVIFILLALAFACFARSPKTPMSAPYTRVDAENLIEA